MILTINDVKNFQGIKGTDKNLIIRALLPGVEDFALEYLNNWFNNPGLRLIDNTVAFVDREDETTNATITISGEKGLFSEIDILPNTYVLICGSRENDGIKLVKSLTDTVLTLHNEENLTPEQSNEDYDVSFFKVNIPKSFKFMLNRMMQYQMSNTASANVAGIASESIGNYSVTYANPEFSNGYPESILKLGAQFKRARFD